MEWLNISLEISQSTGVGLGEDTIARVRTVRDLLAEVAGGAREEVHHALLEDPEAALSERQKRRLQPLGPVSQAVAFCVYC